MIISPLLLAAIYPYNRERVFYISAGITGISSIIQIIFCCRKDAKVLGRSPECGNTSIELPVVETKGIAEERECSVTRSSGEEKETMKKDNEVEIKI